MVKVMVKKIPCTVHDYFRVPRDHNFLILRACLTQMRQMCASRSGV